MTNPRLSKLSIRQRLGLGILILVLPLLLLTFSGYLLLQYTLEIVDTVYEEVSEEFIPVTTLQAALLRAAMPANDYLIHGNPDERREFDLLRVETDAGFSRALDVHFDEPRKHENISKAQRLWQEAANLSDQLLSMPKPVGNTDAAALMEKMDQLIDQAYNQLEYATTSTISDLHNRHDMLHNINEKIRLLIAVFLVVINVLVLFGFILIRRWITAPLAELGVGAQQLAEGHLDYRITVSTQDEIGRVGTTINEMAAALKHDREILHNLTIHDTLTGLLNRREFDRLLTQEIHRATRNKQEFTLILLDVDHFKKINDTYGHPAGDEVLREVATRIQASLRPSDVVARYGGEEFIVMLPETGNRGADAFGERLCTFMRSMPMDISPGIQPVVTISGGIAVFPGDGDIREKLVEAADQSLYAAKSAGRNRCCRYQQPCNPD